MRVIGLKFHNHDCSISEVEDERILNVIELERISGQRYHSENFFKTPERLSYWFEWYAQYRADKKPADVVILDYVIYRHHLKRFYSKKTLLRKIRAEMLRYGLITQKTLFETCRHHEGHAFLAFYTSPYDESLILSFDGAGDDGYTNLYLGSKKGIRLIRKYPYWLGRIYKSQKDFLDGLRYSKDKGGEEAVAGKIMALAAFGKNKPEWHSMITSYIKTFHRLGTRAIDFPEFHRRSAKVLEVLRKPVPVESETALDWLFNFQHCWTEVVRDIIAENMKRWGIHNICLTGGCALNCVANSEISQQLGLRNIYVPPNPSDTGLSLGFAYSHIYKKRVTQKREAYPVSPFRNCRVLDKPEATSSIESRSVSLEEIAGLLSQGKIIAFMIGNSEMGPRALGNRSIICDPSIPGMKDTLNARVKFREHFRPFAPIARVEDYKEYFECNVESPYMSFAPLVKKAYRDTLKEIVHVDGTARLQTVRQETNGVIWRLLKMYKERFKQGVLLNTSFNIKGRPILTTYKDAFEVMSTTELDGLFDGQSLYAKNSSIVRKQR